MAFSIGGGNGMLAAAYLVMNIVGFIMMRIDKTRAQKRKYRISEKNLWLVALFGGAVGTTLGMFQFRHKTKHIAFRFGFPLLAIIEVILFSYFWAMLT
jgi:uncharacterized membrane protein YsdA (DUF1294 family)